MSKNKNKGAKAPQAVKPASTQQPAAPVKTAPVAAEPVKEPVKEQPKPAAKVDTKPKPVPAVPVEEPTVIQTSLQKNEIGTMSSDSLVRLADVMMRRYVEHPDSRMPKNFTEVYAAPGGLIDLVIAEASARCIMDGNAVVLNNLPEAQKEALLSALAINGITISDIKLLDSPISAKTEGVVIDDDAKKQHEKDVATEKAAENAVAEPTTEEELSKVFVKTFGEYKKDNSPILGLCKCVEILNTFDKKNAKDDNARKAILARTYKDTLIRLFSIMPLNMLFLGIGKDLYLKLKEDGNPLSSFAYIKNGSFVKGAKEKTKGFLLSDGQVADLVTVFVSLLLTHFDDVTKQQITNFGDNPDAAALVKIERLKKSIETRNKMLTLITDCPKSCIDDIKNYATEIKNTDVNTLDSDEKKLELKRKINRNKVYWQTRSFFGGDLSKEKEPEAIMRNYMIYILNLFRRFDNQLSLDGRYIVTSEENSQPAPASEPTPAEEGTEEGKK